MEMTEKEMDMHFTETFSKKIKEFARMAFYAAGLDCLIVPNKEDKEKAYCTHCRKWVKIPGNNRHTGSPEYLRRHRHELYYRSMEKKEHDDAGKVQKCPNCGKELNIYHSWRMYMDKLDATISISVFEKSKTEPGAITMRRIEVSRKFKDVDKNGKIYFSHMIEDKYLDAERYLFRMGEKAIRQKRTCLVSDYAYGFKKRCRHKYFFIKRVNDIAGYTYNYVRGDPVRGEYYFDIESFMDAIKQTPYQYLFSSDDNIWDEFDITRPGKFRIGYPIHLVKLLSMYSMHPWIELMKKNGMDNIIKDRLQGEGCFGAINWAAKTAKSAFKKFQKQDFKDVLAYNHKNRNPVREHTLSILVLARQHLFPGLRLKDAIELENKAGYDLLSKLWDLKTKLHLTPEQVFRYCEKQKGDKRSGQKEKFSIFNDWLDYMIDAPKIELDLTDKRNVFPKDLHRMHANILKQIKYLGDKELDKKMEKLAELRNRLFVLEGKSYLIRPAGSSAEIIAEGKILHHCVGGYAERHATGKTNILFLREKANPDTHFYTMEVYKKDDGYSLVQIHGYLNDRYKAIPEAVMRFAKRFMQIVNDRAAQQNDKKVRKTA